MYINADFTYIVTVFYELYRFTNFIIYRAMKVVLTPLGNVYPLRPLQKLMTMKLAKRPFFAKN